MSSYIFIISEYDFYIFLILVMVISCSFLFELIIFMVFVYEFHG